MIFGIPMRHFLALAAMVSASFLAVAAKPTAKVADLGPKVDLEVLVPKDFGRWRVDNSVVQVAPDPKVQATLNKLYNQTLSRTYINGGGERIMLSIAYGGDQSDSLQLHRPEVCYAAQGFQILREAKGALDTAFGAIPVKRIEAQQGPRHEPITYWVTVGDKAIHSGLKQKLVQLGYGVTGKVPDGMLVRVSSIDRDTSRAYTVQASFVQDLVSALSDESRTRLIGRQL
jgi:EpsI family protein